MPKTPIQAMIQAIEQQDLVALKSILPHLPEANDDQWGLETNCLHPDEVTYLHNSPLNNLIMLHNREEATETRDFILHALDLFVEVRIPVWIGIFDLSMKNSTFPHGSVIEKYEAVGFKDKDNYHRGALFFYLIQSDITAAEISPIWKSEWMNLGEDDLGWTLAHAASHPWTYQIVLDIPRWRSRLEFLVNQGFSFHHSNTRDQTPLDVLQTTLSYLDPHQDQDEADLVASWVRTIESIRDREILDVHTPGAPSKQQRRTL
jgi:hypothetical protein